MGRQNAASSRCVRERWYLLFGYQPLGWDGIGWSQRYPIEDAPQPGGAGNVVRIRMDTLPGNGRDNGEPGGPTESVGATCGPSRVQSAD